MPVQININGADAAEALKELSSLAAGFNATPVASPAIKQEESPKRQQRTPKQEAEKPKDEPAQETEKQEEPEKKIELTDEDLSFDEEAVPDDVQLRAAASEAAKVAGRESVKALLDKFEVPNVTAVPKNKRAAFLKELEALV